MKKIIVIGILVGFFSSCGDYYSGELTGVQGRKKYFEPDPFGMQFIPQGSYNAGPSDQDVPFAQNNFSKTVTVEPFWIDQTEITNNEYRQYIKWVKDSLIRELIGDILPDEFRITVDAYDQPLEPDIYGRDHIINWEQKIDKRLIRENAEVRDAINNLYYKMDDRFFGKKEIDVHKLNYRYFWIDLQQAAKRSNAFQNEFKEDLNDLDQDPGSYQGNIIMPDGSVQPIDTMSPLPQCISGIRPMIIILSLALHGNRQLHFASGGHSCLTELLLLREIILYKITDSPSNQNGNLQPGVASKMECIHGEVFIPEIRKVVSLLTLNHYAAITPLMEVSLPLLLECMNRMNTDCMTWQET